LENLLISAEHYGYVHQVEYLPEGDDGPVAVVRLTPQEGAEEHRAPSLFEQIPQRHTDHRFYQDKQISEQEMAQIHACILEEGFWLFSTNEGPYILYTVEELRRRVDELITRADAIQRSAR
jgi:hypothetical protein